MFRQIGRCGACVAYPHRRTLPQAPQGAGQARFAKAENEDVFALEIHHLVFSVDSPNSTSRMVMIQKRMSAFGVAITVEPAALP